MSNFLTWKPHYPKRKIEIDPITQLPVVTLIVKRPRAMKHMMKLEQDSHSNFRWWDYDPETGEAVIVLKSEGFWSAIRILDPMWLLNLSEKDIEFLYYNQNMLSSTRYSTGYAVPECHQNLLCL
ncbi:hypothetical protein Hanom_Chr03g00210651 [Helianthus anomalus]